MKFILSFLLFFIGLNIQAQTVYKTPYGQKYHLSTCRTVNNVSKSLDVNQALKMGLEPCKICKPPYEASLGIHTPTKTPAGVGQKTQCSGTTKKGTQCKHYTSIGNKYCFQHNPNKKKNG